MKIDVTKFKDIIISIADTIEENVEYLTELDASIGDGDHGVNMAKGFKRIKEVLNTNEETDIGKILVSSGKVLLDEIGGAMGPLYGGGLVKAGIALMEKKCLDKDDVYTLFLLLLNSVKELGGAKVGDKTMVDTLEPFVDEYGENIKSLDMLASFEKALIKAKEGMESTKDMISKIGRSSRLLERSRGHIDVGSASSYLILRSFYDSIRDIKE
jgi:dihydroxyacetone kinase-like protein